MRAGLIAAGLTLIAATACGYIPAPPQPTTPVAAATSKQVYATPSPAAAVTYDQAGNIYPVPACTDAGGTTAEDLAGSPICIQIPYLGGDDQTYYTSAGVSSGDGSLQAAGGVDVSVSATQDECMRGYYPEYQGVGPAYAKAGRWDDV